MKALLVSALLASEASATSTYLRQRQRRTQTAASLSEEPDTTSSSQQLEDQSSSLPILIVNKTASEILTEGLEEQIIRYNAGCEAAQGFLFNATAAFNATRDDILAAMEEVSMAVGDAHDATEELLKGEGEGVPEADVLSSLTTSQEKSAHARSMRKKMEALSQVKAATEVTTKKACDKLQATKDELESHKKHEYAVARKIFDAVHVELKAARRQLHAHLMEAKADAEAAQLSQEQGVLPGSVVTQQVLVVEHAVRAAKASKAFVSELSARAKETEMVANEKHLLMAGVNMPEVQARIDAAAAPDETPPGWSTPKLTSLRQKYEEANAGAKEARELVLVLRSEMAGSEEGEASGGGASGGGASGASGAASGVSGVSGASGVSGVSGASGSGEELSYRFRELMSTLMVADASGGSDGEDGDASGSASGGAADDAAEEGTSGSDGASGIDGASSSGAASGSASSGSASGSASENEEDAGKGPASVVTHVMKSGDKTIVTTTTFHNEENGDTVWEKVKHLEEHKCEGCNEDGATTSAGTGGAATGAAAAATGGGGDATGMDATGSDSNDGQMKASEASEFNARLSSMENALMGAISESNHTNVAAERKEKELTSTIATLRQQLDNALAAGAAGAPKDPLSALKHIHMMGTLTGDDDVGMNGAAGNLTLHAKELREASLTTVPEDADVLATIAKKLETLGKKEDTKMSVTKKKKEEEEEEEKETAPGASSPTNENEQLQLVAKRLASAIQGRSFGVTAQREERGVGASGEADSGAAGSGGDSGGGASGASGDGTTEEEDMAALRAVAIKLTALVSGGDNSGSASGSGSSEEEQAPVNVITQAMEALSAAASAEDGGSEEGEEEVGGGEGEDVESEVLDDDQLEQRVEKLQTHLNELRAAASGGASGTAEGGEGEEEEAQVAEPNDGTEGENVVVPANGQEEGAAAEGGGEEKEENSATPEAPKPGEPVTPVTPGGENSKDFKKAAMVDRNTIQQHLESSGEEAGGEGVEESDVVKTVTEGAGMSALPPAAAEEGKNGGGESPEIVKTLNHPKPSSGEYTVTATTR